MSKVIETNVSTKNVKGFVHASEGIEGSDGEIVCAVKVTVPETAEEAASEEFYGSEEAVNNVIAQDWQRRCVNAARPILREAETELDFDTIAQQAVDGYKPGRRGGFAPRVSEADLDQFDNVDDLREFLKGLGVVKG